LTVVVKPVAVLAFRINPTTVETLSNNMPLQARAMCGKNRRSMGLYFEQYGG
jgi:hypothetical protein